jgi:tetratricopeptide (TPR) repeat protein
VATALLAGNAARHDRAAIEAARAACLDAIREGSASPEALYLEGTSEHLLLGDAQGEEALRTLSRAVEEHGLRSADALYRQTTILHAQGRFPAAVETATAALDAPLTEAEVLVSLGGHRAALSGELRAFRRDVHVQRALAWFQQEPADYRRCVEDCRAATALDEHDAFSRYLAGFAKGRQGEHCAARDDIRESLRLVEAGFTDELMDRVRDDARRSLGHYQQLCRDGS